MVDEKKSDQEQQELDELTVLQDAEKRDLSAEEQAGVEDVEGQPLDTSDLAGTILADTGREGDALYAEGTDPDLVGEEQDAAVRTEPLQPDTQSSESAVAAAAETVDVPPSETSDAPERFAFSESVESSQPTSVVGARGEGQTVQQDITGQESAPEVSAIFSPASEQAEADTGTVEETATLVEDGSSLEETQTPHPKRA